MDLNFAVDGDLRELSAEETWKTIENFAQGQKEWDKPFKAITECISWDKVDNSSSQSTPQVLPSFEVYTPPVTYQEEVEETIGISMEVEPLDKTQLENLGLNTCNHDIPLRSREVPNFDEPEPQPNFLPNFPPLDISLGDKRGPEPPIKQHSPDSFRMKVVDNLTIHTPPSPHVASFHPKDMYCYYHPCIDDNKKHYGFKPGLLGYSESLRVDFSNLEVIEDDWELKSKDVSFLGRGLNLPVRLKEVKKTLETASGFFPVSSPRQLCWSSLETP
ncbi:hypothetical protein Tco_1165908 [Tanacetum coccineum]